MILQTKKLRHTKVKEFCQDNMVSRTQDWGPISSLNLVPFPLRQAPSHEVQHDFESRVALRGELCPPE